MDHPTIDPDLISIELGMKSAKQWKAGDARTRADGTDLGGRRERTYWCSRAKRGEDSELLQVLDEDLGELETKRGFLRDFCASGGWIQYYISWFASDRSGGETIPYGVLERLVNLQISLSLEVYSHRQDLPHSAGAKANDSA